MSPQVFCLAVLSDILREQMERIAQAKGTLGFAFLIGLLISLWSANGGMKALFDALNVVYGEKEKRSFIWLNSMSLSFTVAAIVFLIVAVANRNEPFCRTKFVP